MLQKYPSHRSSLPRCHMACIPPGNGFFTAENMCLILTEALQWCCASGQMWQPWYLGGKDGSCRMPLLKAEGTWRTQRQPGMTVQEHICHISSSIQPALRRSEGRRVHWVPVSSLKWLKLWSGWEKKWQFMLTDLPLFFCKFNSDLFNSRCWTTWVQQPTISSVTVPDVQRGWEGIFSSAKAKMV